MIIVHVAKIILSSQSGMGRIAYCWKEGFEKDGHQFYHIGINEVRNAHISVWGYYARKLLNGMQIKCDIVLVHEPHSGFFISSLFKTIVFSHGLEERGWTIRDAFQFEPVSTKSKLFPKSLRFLSHNKGIRKSQLVLVSNKDDIKYLTTVKGIRDSKIKTFKNGYQPFELSRVTKNGNVCLYNASWIGRKGVDLMYETFNAILSEFPDVQLILAGTVVPESEVLKGFESSLRNQIRVLSKFSYTEEATLYESANIFVMPSFYEGQSLALTQAMAMGLCPLASDNCGQKDFIQPDVNGLLFKTGDSEHFTSQLRWLIRNSEKTAQYGVKARESVRHLTWDNVSEEVVNDCKQVQSGFYDAE
jgi:glycosyltransferase involved in cell wall biosynthesis